MVESGPRNVANAMDGQLGDVLVQITETGKLVKLPPWAARELIDKGAG